MSAVTSRTDEPFASQPPRSGDGAPSSVRTVVHVLGSLDRGGVERRTLELLEALKGQPVRSIICTLSGREGELAAAYRQIGVKIVPLDIRNPHFPVLFTRLLRRERVDVVHSHVMFASGYILALAAIVGVTNRIAHFNSDAAIERRTSPLRRLRQAVLRRLTDRASTSIVGVAPNSLETNWGPRWKLDHRFTVIPSGVNLRAFPNSFAQPLRDELKISAQTSLVLHLGRADIPTKNRELAVLVVAECRRRGRDVELVFVGRDGAGQEGELNRASLRALAYAEGAGDYIRFLGERADIAEILSSSDALLFTSRREGLPGVLIEAVASSTPVVSSDVPGAEYIAQQIAGVTIVGLSEPVEAWADVLSEVLDKGWARTSETGSDVLRGTVFDLDSCLQSYWDLWHLR